MTIYTRPPYSPGTLLQSFVKWLCNTYGCTVDYTITDQQGNSEYAHIEGAK